MSLFNDSKYDYWFSHFLYIWSIRSVNLDNRLLSILDQRSASLLLISKHLENNAGIEINSNDFMSLPATYEDLQAFTFIANNYLGNKFQILNHSILYTP